ncbi:MAG: hypothetical protein JWQ38_2307, partial [Flavipsychrobacter sp.]|nr:hypothetical protein [Flavipsychrobacter sp.]
MSEKNILVPIKIETLVVDEITARQAIWKDLSLDYLAISKRLGVQLEPGELRQLQSSLYKKGAHLHWALPAALTNGIYIDSKMVFPAVPNRWLIIRTHKTDNKPAATKSWIIESDYVKGTTQFVILNDAGSFENTKIGKATELKDWTTEAPQLPDPLTAFAPGNPAFAAIYSSCKDVFGFHDNLNDIDKGTISYMVSGWYSDKAINPLNSAQKGVRDNIISKWSLGIKEEFPADILCHGFIHTIDWDKNKPYELLEKNAAVNIGVGYTAVEAKAAQIARQTGAAEKLLSAYFYDILKNIEGASEIESLADSRAFSSVDGGVLWEIKRSERSTKENDKELKKNEFPDERENPGLAGYFKELNSEQRKCDSLKAKKISMQAEFRALSDKIIRNSLDNKANETILRSIETILTGKRDQLRKEIDIIFLQLSTALNKIKELKNQISAYAVFKPAASGQKPEFELLEGKYPRFWRPNDPVTVFSGAGVRKSEKYKSAGSPETLQCRVPSEIISSIVLYNENAIGQKTITPKPIKLEVKALNTSLTPERISLIEKLYSEASLLDPTRTIERANEYYDRLTEDNELVKALGNSIRSVLNGTIDGNNVNIRKLISSGGTILEQEVKDKISIRTLADKLGIQKWKHPWTPVYMIWYARWTPSYTIENKKQVYCNNDWVWKDKKYLYKGKGIKEEGTIQYSGKAILTDGINNILAARLADGQSDHNISQALASFSDALLMRQ